MWWIEVAGPVVCIAGFGLVCWLWSRRPTPWVEIDPSQEYRDHPHKHEWGRWEEHGLYTQSRTCAICSIKHTRNTADDV